VVSSFVPQIEAKPAGREMVSMALITSAKYKFMMSGMMYQSDTSGSWPTLEHADLVGNSCGVPTPARVGSPNY
jgi:hypothetical protein